VQLRVGRVEQRGQQVVIIPSMSSEVDAITETTEKDCSLYLKPPRRNAVPSTSSKLERTDPSSES